MQIFIFLCAFLSWSLACAQQARQSNPLSTHHVYLGLQGGYGSTTWTALVPTPENQNMGMRTSTPIVVNEGGGIWGFLAGYEFGPHFALEANYSRYPNATVSFDEESIFAFEHDGLLDLHTDTEAISLMAKLMLNVPRTALRGYSSFGVAEIRRWDEMNETTRVSPSFGVGFIYDISQHIMAELAFNYIAGYGESELNPAQDYVPFLYSGVFKLAYKF